MLNYNIFDKAARFTIRFCPEGLFGWLLGEEAVNTLRGWVDTRNIVFPGDSERTGDTVARFQQPDQPPWAIAVEFQLEPDATMFGRLMVYLGNIWLGQKPDEERGSRFQVAGVVVNLTGRGSTSRNFRWSSAKLGTELQIAEVNFIEHEAEPILLGIEQGTINNGMLPWVPLMQGGGELAVVQKWRTLAERLSSTRKKNEFKALASVFANATDCADIWKKELEGWNVKQSQFANDLVSQGLAEGLAEGFAEGLAKGQILGEQKGHLHKSQEIVLEALAIRFGTLSPELTAKVYTQVDLTVLQNWFRFAITAPTLDAFREQASL